LLVGASLPIASAIAPSPAGAATFRLVPSQYPTIKAAITASVAGDTVVVAAGTYHGSFTFQGKDITVVGSSRNRTVLAFDQGPGVRIGPRGTLTGFTLQDAGEQAAVITVSANSVVRGNTFVDNHADGLGVAAIKGSQSTPIIDSNVFWGNDCPDEINTGVVGFTGTSQPVIRNNQFLANGCPAINMSVDPGRQPVVTNNTLVGNRGGIYLGLLIGGPFDRSGQIFRNNLIVENTVGLDMPSVGDVGPTWEHNLVFDNGIDFIGVDDPTGTNGNIAVAPKFVDEFAVDHHLAPGSPAIDAGSLDGAPTTDFDGTARPSDGDGTGGSAVDMFGLDCCRVCLS
jgi:hypothetical protein